MKQPFLIDKEAIKSLTDAQAHELVARLCKAECRACGSSEAGVTWGGDLRASDGGVDVRAKLNAGTTGSGFIPRPSTAFQVKAEEFPPSKIAGEVTPGGKPREIYAELAAEGGAYVIVSTRDDCSDKYLSARRAKIGEALAAVGFENSFHHDFYCSRRIADWVEKHPTITIWLRNILSKPLAGWRPYGAWAYKQADDAEDYLLDKQPRIFTPKANEGSDVHSAINQMRAELLARRAIRLVGLSGMGKTRLVQALFDQRIVTDAATPNADDVVYCDIGDEPNPMPAAMIDALAAEEGMTFVIVDNCSQEEHDKLVQRAAAARGKVGLVTVEYDIRDSVPDGTSVYRLEGASAAIIEQLLANQFGILSYEDRRRIADYSAGNARIALALAETAEATGEFATLRNAELFERLFHQKSGKDDSLLHCAEVASLLYSFDGDSHGEESEVAILAGIAGALPRIFNRQMAELGRRGLLQKRGIWRAVLPHAIANQLASRAMEHLSAHELIEQFYSQASWRVARSFTRRLGYLHDSEKAVAIARDLLGPHGDLARLAALDETRRQMFKNLAPLCPESALTSIEQAQADPAFTSTENSARSEFIRLARAIAYDQQYFERAAQVLAKFAAAETTDHSGRPASEALAELFHIIASGTLADVGLRRSVAQGFFDAEAGLAGAGFLALDAALATSGFGYVYQDDFGSRPRNSGWRPASLEEEKKWFQGWLALAEEVAARSAQDKKRVKAIIAGQLRGLWRRQHLIDDLAGLAGRFAGEDGWPEAWLASRFIIRYDLEAKSPNSAETIRQISEVLRPKNLLMDVRARVFSRGYYVDDFDDDDALSRQSVYGRALATAERLGQQAAQDPRLLPDLVRDLLENDPNEQLFQFGFGFGNAAEQPMAALDLIKISLTPPAAEKMPMRFVRGLIAGWNKVDEAAVEGFLERALSDPFWCNWFAELQLEANLHDRAFSRLLAALQGKDVSIWPFQNLPYRMGDELLVEQTGELLRAIRSKRPDGCFVEILILSKLIMLTEKTDTVRRGQLQELAFDLVENTDWTQLLSHETTREYHVDEVLRFALQAAAAVEKIKKMLARIVALGRDREHGYTHVARLLPPFFDMFPEMALDAIYIPDEARNYEESILLLGYPFSKYQPTPLQNISSSKLISWCKVSPEDRYPFAAFVCPLFTKGDHEPVGLSPVALDLLRSAPDKQAVIAQFIIRFPPSSWSGSRARIMEDRLHLFNALQDGSDPRLVKILETAERDFRKAIEAERISELAFEQAESGRFE